MLCKMCRKDKPSDAFYRRVKSRCMDCHKLRMKELRLTDPAVQERDRIRAKKPARKEMARRNGIRWRLKNPEGYKAQTAVGNAIRDGKLKKGPCAICGGIKNVHAHHSDYSKPLDVKWLCAKCHHRLHAAFPELGANFREAAE